MVPRSVFERPERALTWEASYGGEYLRTAAQFVARSVFGVVMVDERRVPVDEEPILAVEQRVDRAPERAPSPRCARPRRRGPRPGARGTRMGGAPWSRREVRTGPGPSAKDGGQFHAAPPFPHGSHILDFEDCTSPTSAPANIQQSQTD